MTRATGLDAQPNILQKPKSFIDFSQDAPGNLILVLIQSGVELGKPLPARVDGHLRDVRNMFAVQLHGQRFWFQTVAAAGIAAGNGLILG